MSEDPRLLDVVEDVAPEEEAVPVQSAAGENAMLDVLRLKGSTSRMSTWDGKDENGCTYQLKSVTTGQVTTARDVGLHTLKVWRSEHWVIAKGRNLANRFQIEEMRFLHPEWLEPRFKEIEAKILKGLEFKQIVLDSLDKDQLTPAQLDRLDKILTRGATENNPKISWKKISGEYRSIKMELDRAADQLRELVEEHPVTSSE